MNKEKDKRKYTIIGAAMEVHNILGSGFLEAVYQEALGLEFTLQNIPYKTNQKLSIYFKEYELKTFYKPFKF